MSREGDGALRFSKYTNPVDRAPASQEADTPVAATEARGNIAITPTIRDCRGAEQVPVRAVAG